MGNLYIKIDKVVIKGEIRELTRVVTQMGQRMQDISGETENMKSTLLKYVSSNMGKQYDKAAKAILMLSELLYSASLDINHLQNDIVNFQNSSFAFEEMSEYAAKPQPHLVQKVVVDVNTNVFYFTRNDFVALASGIHKYCSDAHYIFNLLIQNVDEMGRIWVDQIYGKLRELINELITKCRRYVNDLEEYAHHLDIKIKEYK